MKLDELIRQIPNFGTWPVREQVKLFAWHLHTQKAKASFTQADVKACYEELFMQAPNLGPYISQMRTTGQVLGPNGSYLLERQVREALDKQYGLRPTTYQIHQDLQRLPDRLPDVAERQFLSEALICLRNNAPRAAIVMTWNLAYDHLCNFILSKHLAAFNTALAATRLRVRIRAVGSRDDFPELKESEVLEVARTAGILNADVYKIMKEKLGTRNTAAHPNTVILAPVEAEAFVSALVNNVVVDLV